MISYVTGNLFESPAQTIVNTVNTVGVMGKGIALQFKRIYPDMFRRYQELCEDGTLKVGTLYLYRTPHKLVLNFPTKKHWRHPSKPEYIEDGLKAFVASYERMGVHSIAFPPLGCGNGELDFDATVRPLMEHYLSNLPISVYIYAPHPKVGIPEHRNAEMIKEWLRSSPQDLPFDEVWADLQGMLRDRRSFETLTKGTPFEAEYRPADDAVRIWAIGKTITVACEEFRETWKQLREFGILTPSALPSKLERNAAHLLPLLAALPYVRVVALSGDYWSFNHSPTRALQLTPTDRAGAQQSQLEFL